MKIAFIASQIVALYLPLGPASPASAAPPQAHASAQDVVVSDAWSRPVPAGLQTGVVYMALTNRTPVADRLISAASPVATKMELHRSSMVGGMMTMTPVPGGLAIPPHSRVDIAPNGYHFMLIGLRKGLEPGQSFPVTLRFARAGLVTVKVKVLVAPPDAAGMGGMAGMARQRS
jgi:copper(I)-binding protein